MAYVLGSNGSQQLGLDHTDDVNVPTPLSSFGASLDVGVAQVAAGGNHTLLLFKNGTVYATGTDEDGRAGNEGLTSSHGRHGLLPMVLPPCNINDHPHQIKQVSATWEASFLLSTTGQVLVCGTGLNGELGLGLGTTKIKVSSEMVIPKFPPEGTEVVQLASSMAHTVAVLSSGEVYGWGKGRKGQLGSGNADSWSPQKLEGISFRAVRAVCGKDFTCVVGEPGKGEVVVLGPSKGDRFGVRSTAPIAIPRWKDVAASWGTIYLLFESGEIHAWGRDDHGQLPPANLPAIDAIAAGSEHMIAKTKAGQVLAWGWGEHGNCGKPTDDSGDIKCRWNLLEVPGEVLGLGAGCATSWIITAGATNGTMHHWNDR